MFDTKYSDPPEQTIEPLHHRTNGNDVQDHAKRSPSTACESLSLAISLSLFSCSLISDLSTASPQPVVDTIDPCSKYFSISVQIYFLAGNRFW
ncbi:hypothetical protein QCA50_020467 [Cerrena zonata]|uniref:Uncharacterized protein n=1 Tax=Cerrena zonata TaxID=2478898 RepID=A0AAW0FFJ9_9APHY